MKVLWLCNIVLPMIAEHLSMQASNKEGWLSGLSNILLDRAEENQIELGVAFPVSKEWKGLHKVIEIPSEKKYKIEGFGFYEDLKHPEKYNKHLETQFLEICERFQPDVIHCFGTEYPHTLAMCKAAPNKNRILIGIQGLCSVYANTYFANLPEKVIQRATFRDVIKGDSLKQQYDKFVQRGKMEMEAIGLAGHITGRTAWDQHYAKEWNKEARYHPMNETLRSNFYEGKWNYEGCEPYSIFLSQGDYPIKGLHYVLLALPKILKKYPNAKVYIAGNSIVKEKNILDYLKISSYGLYIKELIHKNKLEKHVEFLGPLNASQMKERYLKSHVFLCPSTIENSPNSLGEAMMLGMPCVSAQVGGIDSIFTDGEDGILYPGFRTEKNSYDNTCDDWKKEEITLENNVKSLAEAVIKVFDNKYIFTSLTANARMHAKITHDCERNYRFLMDIYSKIITDHQDVIDDMKKLVFVSNYINHHQIPICNMLYGELQNRFLFIQTEPMEEERKQMGWKEEANLPYVRNYYEEEALCDDIINAAEVVFFGGTEREELIKKRLKSQKIVIRYHERLYKTGQWKAISPKGLLKKYKDHIQYRKDNVFMLCAGAYVASDFSLIKAYPNKMLKWGYFPQYKAYDVDKLMYNKKRRNILWAARCIDWKHPELPLVAAKYLRNVGIVFHLDMIGTGYLAEEIQVSIAKLGLQDFITFHGQKSPEEVRRMMEEAAIFLVTSDRQEGWGAVVNEAMNSGCAVIGNHMVGAIPYMIEPGVNGLIYKDGQEEMLYKFIVRLLSNQEECMEMGRKAIQTVDQLWNAEVAARELLQLSERLIRKESCEEILAHMPKKGPCSIAPIVKEKNSWKDIMNGEAFN